MKENRMKLLQDIQNAAIDKNESATNLLRRCLILATRLQNASIRAWVESELSGYGPDDALPDYRKFGSQVKGHFVGWFGRQVNNFTVPPGALPEQLRVAAKELHVRGPIRELEQLLEGDASSFMMPGGDLPLHLGNVLQEMNCVAAWYEIPRGSVEGLVDAIRTRILTLTLDLESSLADDQPRKGSTADAVEDLVKKTLYGMDQ
ncbi:MAG: hypothetical protein HYR64_01935 [Fimbriimonas ginsengisoli]|uniref:AbiTii domain-containing protein n=1 Tax=Fimbriimonas ginsengisoli TaxID=1005039 RepID=A0A931PVR1_FIMGI|nr:hypothetical protein [Fimbriimonas ginsengisoli]